MKIGMSGFPSHLESFPIWLPVRCGVPPKCDTRIGMVAPERRIVFGDTYFDAINEWKICFDTVQQRLGHGFE